jgi:hypothetical protein
MHRGRAERPQKIERPIHSLTRIATGNLAPLLKIAQRSLETNDFRTDALTRGLPGTSAALYRTTTMQSSMTFRLVLVFLAAMQLFLPAAAEYAEARSMAAAESPWSALHIESERSTDCPPGHPDHCAFCHFAGHFAAPARATGMGTLPPESHARVLAGTAAGPHADASRLPLSRAPPRS